MDTNKIARDAFYGNNEALMSVINIKRGYTLNGEFFPANGLSLNEVIETIESMSALALALEILKTGNEAEAWKIAQQDKGLLPTVTKPQWLAFAAKCIARRTEEDNAPIARFDN